MYADVFYFNSHHILKFGALLMSSILQKLLRWWSLSTYNFSILSKEVKCQQSFLTTVIKPEFKLFKASTLLLKLLAKEAD